MPRQRLKNKSIWTDHHTFKRDEVNTEEVVSGNRDKEKDTGECLVVLHLGERGNRW